MKLNRTQKADLVKTLATRLQESPNLYLTDFTGIAVKPMTEFRTKLRSAGVQYQVVKNTLALQALEQASVSGLDEMFAGPTAVVFAGEDPITAAKLIAEFQKDHDSLTVKAGFVEGRAVFLRHVVAKCGGEFVGSLLRHVGLGEQRARQLAEDEGRLLAQCG